MVELRFQERILRNITQTCVLLILFTARSHHSVIATYAEVPGRNTEENSFVYFIQSSKNLWSDVISTIGDNRPAMNMKEKTGT